MFVFPDFHTVHATLSQQRNELVWTKRVCDMETPVSAMQKLQAFSDAPAFLLESVHGGEKRGRYSLLGLYPDRIWQCRGSEAQYCDLLAKQPSFVTLPDPALLSLDKELSSIHIDLPQDVPKAAAGLFGYVSYDIIKQFETLPHANPDPINIPDACLMRPRLVLIFDNVDGMLYLCCPLWHQSINDSQEAYHQAAALIEDTLHRLQTTPLKQPHFPPSTSHAMPAFSSNMSAQYYRSMVTQAQDYIRAGDIFQVVPSQRFEAAFDAEPFALYRALRHSNPSPFLFYLDLKDFALVGSSPEILVRLRDDTVTIRPIAGTRKRGATMQEDEALEQDLLADPKELAEHLMLLDLGRNDVGRTTQPGTVIVTEQMTVERYSHVMHIVSNVEGKKRNDITALQCLLTGMPAGTVSGAPKIRAMEIIDELEPVARSFYAGGVGYFSCNGWMDTCITLRTALIKDQTLYVQAGGGVVADSDPQAEYEESCNKAKAIMVAAQLAMQLKES